MRMIVREYNCEKGSHRIIIICQQTQNKSKNFTSIYFVTFESMASYLPLGQSPASDKMAVDLSSLLAENKTKEKCKIMIRNQID